LEHEEEVHRGQLEPPSVDRLPLLRDPDDLDTLSRVEVTDGACRGPADRGGLSRQRPVNPRSHRARFRSDRWEFLAPFLSFRVIGLTGPGIGGTLGRPATHVLVGASERQPDDSLSSRTSKPGNCVPESFPAVLGNPRTISTREDEAPVTTPGIRLDWLAARGTPYGSRA
jgi:hypothetical protein